MNRMLNTARALALVALAIILVGCSSPTVVVQPTQDIPSVRTEAAKTIVAKITIEAALNPTATPAAPQTVVITATPAPTEAAPASPVATWTSAPKIAPTATLRVSTGGTGTGTGTGSSGVVYPTATRRAGPDQATFVSNTPSDGTRFNAGEVFDAVWTFKNVGTSTWNSTYSYRFVKGTQLATKDYYAFPKEVKPGETVQLIADMVAPPDHGRYTSYWEMRNANGDVFGQFFIIIDVK